MLADEEGNVTISAAGAIGAVVVFLALVGGLAKYIIDGHRAQVVAELAAVSATHNLFAEAPDPCAVAHEVSNRNGGELTACQVVESDVVVTIRVRTHSATARAGPL